MSGPLVLSLFPGIGLFDMAFEEEGFCVVRGPDLLWGGDIQRFHPPAGRFEGVIGGPPCQAFSRLRLYVEHNGYRVAPNLIPEFERCVADARPSWFVMENVPDAPAARVVGYHTEDELIRDVWVGGETNRLRRFTFGSLLGEARLQVEQLALHRPDPEPPVCKQSLDRGGRAAFEKARRLQGLPDGWELPGFSMRGKMQALFNGVPLPMGRAIAKAVKAALSLEEAA